MLAQLYEFIKSWISSRNSQPLPESGWELVNQFTEIHNEPDSGVRAVKEKHLQQALAKLPEGEYHDLLGFIEEEMEFWERFRYQLQQRTQTEDPELKVGLTV